MAVPYIGHLRARVRARFHVQIEVTSRESNIETAAAVPITGRVVRVFRGAISVGDEITFSVHVMRTGDDIWLRPSLMMIGPSFMPYETFIRTSHMEAFLN